QQLGQAEGTGFGLDGTLDYQARMRVDANGPSAIEMTSDLAGLNVDWPEPLAKTAGQTAQLEARVDPFVEEGVRITGDWQDRMALDLLWKESALDLRFDYLSLGSHRLTDITISALDLGDRWVVNTESERAAGRMVIPDDDGVVQVDLHTLHLSREDASTEQDQAPELLTLEQQLEAFRQLDIGSWPDVDGRISNLKLGGESAGSWSFRLRPAPHQLNVEAIEGRLGALELAGDMVWRVVDDRETTRFQGQLTGGALKDLEALTGSSIPMTNQATAVELDIDWPGGPNDIGLSALSGEVSVRLDDGVILEQNNSAQLFRVFNLLNTDTLWRRLRLDFSDLYERGVAFDAISGKARISDGLVTMDPELQLVGPSGAFKINGTTNMADESLDMRLVVVLPVTQNLPLAAILMGASAPIGGALFVLDKILGDPLSKLTSATYSVTGSWSEPEVDLRSVFDTAEQ
ncbi:MAG: YhdP family protein, partial [Marinobacter vinifirmus]